MCGSHTSGVDVRVGGIDVTVAVGGTDVNVAGIEAVEVAVNVGREVGVAADAHEVRKKKHRKNMEVRFITFYRGDAQNAKIFKPSRTSRLRGLSLQPTALDDCRADFFFQILRFRLITLQLGEHLLAQ